MQVSTGASNDRAFWAALRADPLIRLLALHAGLGAIVAIGVVVLLIALDVGGLATLIAGSEAPLVAVLLLATGFVVTFSSASAGAAVMTLRDDRRGGGGGTPQAVPAPSARTAPTSSARRRRVL